jgi:predicted transcriptional regulator of viral defense system
MEEFYLNRALFRTQEIINDFASERSMQVKLKALTENGRIAKIKNGLYATVNTLTGDIFANRFEIATALFDNACVAYHSALEFHGLGNQMYSEVQVFTEKRYGAFEYNGLAYKFFLYTAKGGISRLEQNAKIVVTDLERTVVDCLDRIDLAGGLEELVQAINGITYLNEQTVLNYLEEYDKKFLYKKAGFLLSLLKRELFSQAFFETCKGHCSTKIEDISENKKLSRKMDKDWGIIYPSKLINTEN